MTNTEPAQMFRSLLSIYEDARAAFSSLMGRRQERVGVGREFGADQISSYGWEPDVPAGQMFDPGNCYIFKRVG